MTTLDVSAPPRDLQRRVLSRTGWRVRDLRIELNGGRAILRGQATTTHARQLAEHAAQEMLPDVRLENAIQVEHEAEVLTGMPLH
jgi:hypothetical protein